MIWFFFESLYLLKVCRLRPDIIQSCCCLKVCHDRCSCCKCKWWKCSWLVLFLAVGMQCGVWVPLFALTYNWCLACGVTLIISPFTIFGHIVMWRANLGKLCVLHIVMMLIISSFGWFYYSVSTFCLMVNVQYIVYSLCAPLMVFLIFKANSEFIPEEWAECLVGIFIVSFDVLTSLFVVYAFIESCHYIFAVFQCLCIIAGQVAGAVLDIITGDDTHKMTKMDKIMGIFGFSHIWYVIKWWEESSQKETVKAPKYQTLKDKHKIWDLMVRQYLFNLYIR